MSLAHFVIIKLTFYLIVGILLGRWLEPELESAMVLTFGSLAFLALFFYTPLSNLPFAFGGCVAIATICLGMLCISFKLPGNSPTYFGLDRERKDETWQLLIKEELRPTSYYRRYVTEVIRRGNKRKTGRLLIKIQADTPLEPLGIDNRIAAYGNPELIPPAANPYQFDYQAYMAAKGIYHQLIVRDSSILIMDKRLRTLRGYADALRRSLISGMRRSGLGSEQLGVSNALLLGYRHDINQETKALYRDAGAAHLLAISGLHVGVLLLLLNHLLRPIEYLPRGKKIKLLIIISLLWGYAFLAGLTPSVIRAVTMFSFLSYSLVLRRPGNSYNILALSIFFILLIHDPRSIFNAGFQMSYLAVLAILWIHPKIHSLWKPKSIVFRKTWQLLCVSFAAQLGVLPISLYYFGQFPGLFFISSLLIVPVLGGILGFGILIMFLQALGTLPQFLVIGYDRLIWGMNKCIAWIASQEVFILRDITTDITHCVLAYGMIITLVLFFRKPKLIRLRVLALFLTGIIGWSGYKNYHMLSSEELLIPHLVGQSMLLHRNAAKITQYSDEGLEAWPYTAEYASGTGASSISIDTLMNCYKLGSKRLLFLNSDQVINPYNGPADILVLRGSPRINLDRVINRLQPSEIIADGSNYNSFISRWARTCRARKIPFHATNIKGAYILSQ